MACYKVIVNKQDIGKKYSTQQAAQEVASKISLNPKVPNSFKSRVGGNTYLNYNKLEEFAMYDRMYTLEYNNLAYGDISLGHKNADDVIKRNGNLPSDGLSLGFGKVRTAIIQAESTVVNGNEIDSQDAQTYASPYWYLNKYLKATGKADPIIIDIFKRKIIPGLPLTKEELATLKAGNADLTDRKIVIRTHTDLIKTAFHIQSREKTSKLKNPNDAEEVVRLYEQVEKATTLDAKREILKNIHSKYMAIDQYHHDMLNSLELNQLDYITVDSSAKLAQYNVGSYDSQGGFRLSPYEISDTFVREQMKTDKKDMNIVHGSQLQGLVTAEQDKTTEIETKKGKTTVGKLVNRYFNLQSQRTNNTVNKQLDTVLTEDDANYNEIVETIMQQSNTAQGDANLAALIEVNDNKPKVSLNNNLIAKSFNTALLSKLDKGLKTKVPGKAYTLVSDTGYSVYTDAKGDIVPRAEFREGLNERKLQFDNQENDIYYAEVIVSQDVLNKLGVSNIKEANEALFGLGVRIPTEGKNSMVVIKIVDTLPSTYSSTIIAPPALLAYSGADFDIDKLYVRHFSLTKDKKKYGHYLTIRDKAKRLKRAEQEYRESTGRELPNNFAELVENNYNNPLDSTPLTTEEINNDLLDIEMQLAYNKSTLNQAKYVNSLASLKDVLAPWFTSIAAKLNIPVEAFDQQTVDSFVDKVEAQNSIDIGAENIGIVANFNILNTLLSEHNISGGFIFGQNRSFGETTELDLGTDILDSKGLTTGGKIRTNALIAVLLNAMTDNAKERLAAEFNFTAENLSLYLTGIALGIDPKVMLVTIQRPKTPSLPTLYNSYRLELSKDNSLENVIKKLNLTDEDIKLFEKIDNALDTYTDKDVLKILEGTDYDGFDSKTALAIAGNLMDTALFTIEETNGEISNLSAIRSLIKGIKKDFKAVDNVLKAAKKLKITAKKTNTKLPTNLDKRLHRIDDTFYYRPVLGNEEVVEYEFIFGSSMSSIIASQPNLLELFGSMYVYNEQVLGKYSLKRNQAITGFHNVPTLMKGSKKARISPDIIDPLLTSFTAYLSSRVFEYKLNKAIDAADGTRKENLTYLRDNIQSLKLLQHPKGEKSKIAQLRDKLLDQNSKFANNLFINNIVLKTREAEDYNVTTVTVDTLNEVSTDHKDMIADDLQVLNNAVPTTYSLKELDNKPISELTDEDAAFLLRFYVGEYSYLVNNNSYRKGSISTVMPHTTLFNYYKHLNELDDLFKEYANRPPDAKFYKSFEEITGTNYERFILEFYTFEGQNKRFGFEPKPIVKVEKGRTLNVDFFKGDNQTIDRQVTLKNGTTSNISIATTVKANVTEFKPKEINNQQVYKNRYFVRSNDYKGYKAMVFPPAINGNNRHILSRVIAADAKGELFEYIYDKGIVYKTKVNDKFEPVGTTVESDFMPLSGIYANYSISKPYANKVFANTISPASFYTKLQDANYTEKIDTNPESQAEYGEPINIIDSPLSQMSGQQQGGVKEGVKELFESNSELTSVGTPEQYSQYLNTIFPDSKVKDIVYHGTPDGRFDSFDVTKAGKATFQPTQGVYFTDSKKTADFYAEGSIDFSQFESLEEYQTVKTAKVFAAILNAKTLNLVDNPQAQEKQGDAILRTKEKIADTGIVGEQDLAHQYIVFNPEQIHILGSKEDIEGFKKFVSTQPTTQQQQTEQPQQRTISYTPKGKQRQTYTIRGSQIFNEKGQEVFKEDSVDRNKIFANLAVQEGRAVVVEHKGTNYVVNKRGDIISGTTGKLMQWGEENGDRKAILAKAKFSAKQLLPVEEFINSMLLKHSMNGTVANPTELFKDVREYNETLGYEAVVVNQDMSITPNINSFVKSKTGTEQALSILKKLSAKFNIPFVIDNTMPYKGMYMNGKVYINTRLMTDDTAFHEFAHPFIAAVKKTNRPLYNNLIRELRKEGSILSKTEKLYKQYFISKGMTSKQADNAVLEEAIVQALGEYATDAGKFMDKSSSLLEAVREFFDYIKQTVKDLFSKDKIVIENIPSDTTLKELAVILASDLPIVNETRLRKEVIDVLNQIDRCS